VGLLERLLATAAAFHELTLVTATSSVGRAVTGSMTGGATVKGDRWWAERRSRASGRNAERAPRAAAQREKGFRTHHTKIITSARGANGRRGPRREGDLVIVT